MPMNDCDDDDEIAIHDIICIVGQMNATKLAQVWESRKKLKDKIEETEEEVEEERRRRWWWAEK